MLLSKATAKESFLSNSQIVEQLFSVITHYESLEGFLLVIAFICNLPLRIGRVLRLFPVLDKLGLNPACWIPVGCYQEGRHSCFW